MPLDEMRCHAMPPSKATNRLALFLSARGVLCCAVPHQRDSPAVTRSPITKTRHDGKMKRSRAKPATGVSAGIFLVSRSHYLYCCTSFIMTHDRSFLSPFFSSLRCARPSRLSPFIRNAFPPAAKPRILHSSAEISSTRPAKGHERERL